MDDLAVSFTLLVILPPARGGGINQHFIRFGLMLLQGGGLGDVLVDDAPPAWGGLG